jgi:hypothetical protein
VNKIHHKLCSACCWLFVHYVAFLFTFYSLLTFHVPLCGYSLLYCTLSRMPLTFQSRILLLFLYLRLSSTGYTTALQKALTSPCTEYENCANGNVCNSNYFYNRVIIVPENDRFPLPIGSFVVLTLVVYLRRSTNKGVGSAGGKVLTCETRSTRRTTCPSATLSSTNRTRTSLGSNTVLSVERFAMNRVSHSLWLVSQGEGRLSTYELWASVVNSLPSSPACPHSTVQLYRPVKWLNRWFLRNLRCLAAGVLRRCLLLCSGDVDWRVRGTYF